MLLVALLGVTACSSAPPSAEPPLPVRRDALQAFSLAGRFSLRQEGHSYSGRLDWRHADDSDELLLSSPLGQAMAEIVSTPDGARLNSGDGKLQTAASADELLRQGALNYDAGWWNAQALVQRYQTLQDVTGTRIAEPYRRLPQLTVNALKPDIYGLRFDFKGDYVNFRNPDETLAEELSARLAARCLLGLGRGDLRLRGDRCRRRGPVLGGLHDDGLDEHGEPPAKSTAIAAFVLLCMALVAVVGLAKILAPGIEALVKAMGAPSSFVGVIIALIVLLPETGAAFRAAVRNRMQISLNLALGSALATIGLTIPAIGLVAIVFDMPMVLGLPPKEIVLLVLTFAVSIITLASGRATVLHGTVHLVLFAAFLFLSIVP